MGPRPLLWVKYLANFLLHRVLLNMSGARAGSRLRAKGKAEVEGAVKAEAKAKASRSKALAQA
jgi:hypothetical protein